MRLQREAGVGVAAILAIQLSLSLLTIGLLARMGPAIERILEENVFTGEAVEEMLASLARAEACVGECPEGVPAEFSEALSRAQANITEDAEGPLLATISDAAEAAFARDASARRDLVDSLRELGRVNRESMVRADERAQRLGQAGAWSAVILGALAFALAIGVYRRLRLRIEHPIEDLRHTVHRVREGNLQARCATSEAPHEIREIMVDLNAVLDRWVRFGESAQLDLTHREAEVRRLLLSLLDEDLDQVVVRNEEGETLLMNHAAFGVEVPTEDDPLFAAEGWSAEEVEGTRLRVLRRSTDAEAEAGSDGVESKA